jgi:protein-L-isoaspartate(D-aspartate) O-methyltransferase
MADDESQWLAAREALIKEIVADTRETAAFTGRAQLSPQTYAALRAVPRHAFVDPRDEHLAYLNRPLGIGHAQTISQPFIVALMTDLLDLTDRDRVLEIGTGSGYQAAVLAQLCDHVFSIEVIPELAAAAMARLHRLGIYNVSVRTGDGFRGWPEEAPFDAIIVTAAPSALPPALAEQLKVGGRIVIPVGPPGGTQILYRGVKDANGEVQLAANLPVAFVPMVRRTVD